MVVTSAWQNGSKRTIATGIKVNAGETPEQFDIAFTGKMIEEPIFGRSSFRMASMRSSRVSTDAAATVRASMAELLG
jgi:hypothetical protein